MFFLYRISYVTYTLHFINKDWKLIDFTLKTAQFDHPHTGETIKENFDDCLVEFKLKNKEIDATTDNGSNIVKACRIMSNVTRLGCIAHALHNLLMADLLKHKDMKRVTSLIVKLKIIYRLLLFKHDKLKKIHQLQNSNLLQEFETLDKIISTEELITNFNNAVEVEDDVEDNENILSRPSVAESSSDKENEVECQQLPNQSKFTSIKNSNDTRWNSTLVMIDSFLKNKGTFYKHILFYIKFNYFFF